MKNKRTNKILKRMVFVAGFALFAFQAIVNAQEKIIVGATYVCDDNSKLIVKSCNGTNKKSLCRILGLNEYAPNGIGSDTQVDRETVLYSIGYRKCKPTNIPADAEKTEAIVTETKTEVKTQTKTNDNLLNSLRVDENNTVLANRELLDCDNLKQTKAKNGSTPNPKLLEKLIRCIWEKPSIEGMDGAVTMGLTPLQIGSPRKWIPYKDIGSGGTANTIVYPIKTTYTQRTFYRHAVDERIYDGVFNCYVNTFGEWQCGSADSKQKGQTKRINVLP